MPVPSQRLKLHTFFRKSVSLALISIVLVGNLFLSPPFNYSAMLSQETVQAAMIKNSVPLDSTAVAQATMSIGFIGLALPTPIPTPTVIATPLPDVGISQSNTGLNVFQPGKTITYTLNTYTSAISGPVGPLQPVKVKAVLPFGLQDVTTVGSNWVSSVSVSPNPGATIVVSTYLGLYPILPNTQLPPIRITALTTNLSSVLTCTSTVGVSGDSNPDNNLANNTVYISQAFLSSFMLTHHLRSTK